LAPLVVLFLKLISLFMAFENFWTKCGEVIGTDLSKQHQKLI
jgi:hypothetical protein